MARDNDILDRVTLAACIILQSHQAECQSRSNARCLQTYRRTDGWAKSELERLCGQIAVMLALPLGRARDPEGQSPAHHKPRVIRIMPLHQYSLPLLLLLLIPFISHYVHISIHPYSYMHYYCVYNESSLSMYIEKEIANSTHWMNA